MDVAVAVVLTVFVSALGVYLVDRLDWHRPWCSCGSCDYRAQLRKARRRKKRLDRYFREMARVRREGLTLAALVKRGRS